MVGLQLEQSSPEIEVIVASINRTMVGLQRQFFEEWNERVHTGINRTMVGLQRQAGVARQRGAQDVLIVLW